jgi:hypothetical protein
MGCANEVLALPGVKAGRAAGELFAPNCAAVSGVK